MSESKKRVRVPALKEKKLRGEKITVLTAYDYAMAGLMDRAGIDVLLVGDSLGMVVLGHEDTLSVTMEMMVEHTRAVARGTKHALVVSDMPFLSYQVDVGEAVRNAGRLIQGGAAAVKIEGGSSVIEVARRLVAIGIPVMGHLGLTPQSVHQLGGFRPQAQTPESADLLLGEAKSLEEAGVFSIVLESIPPELAERVTSELAVPTIGIGAGPHCDGQVLVSYDTFGLFQGSVPPFVKQYAQLGDQILEATRAYIEDVKNSRFPTLEKEQTSDRKNPR
ncbi:MAG: 3-methyl-2-oxobutanoate hydroxymethyltransferase [Acidobacteriota bacterium]